MLHGIREGVLAVDAKGAINVLNDEARGLLGLGVGPAGPAGRGGPAAGRLRRVVTGEVEGSDLVAVTDEHLLVLNRMPVTVAGRNAGWVVTIRDRTELEALLRQLDSMEGLSTALRAQEHEFSNRLHVLVRAARARRGRGGDALQQPSSRRDGAGQRGDPGPGRFAPRRGAAAGQVDGRLGARCHRPPRPVEPARGRAGEDLPIVTVLGNLIDNAVDAVADDPRTLGAIPRGEVTVSLTCVDGTVVVSVVRTPAPASPPDGSRTSSSTATRRRSRGAPCDAASASPSSTGWSPGPAARSTASSPGGARFDVRLALRVREGVS